MNTFLAILILVFALILWPLLTGTLFFFFTAGPVLLLTRIFDVVGDVVTCIFAKMLIVPFLGRLCRICLAFVLGGALIGFVTVGIAFPFIAIAVLFATGEASKPDVQCDGWLVDFYCKYFKWLAHICNCHYIFAYSADAKPTDNYLVSMFQTVVRGVPMGIAVLVPWYLNLKIFVWGICNCGDAR